MNQSTTRREFLKKSVIAPSAGILFSQLLSRNSVSGYSKLKQKTDLQPVKDEATGLPLLKLPEGFRYSSFGWKGDKTEDGFVTPENHDGMAVIAHDGDTITLCRNHEIRASKSFGPENISYDSHAGAGCMNLQFNLKSGKWENQWCSLAGTVQNCAGGPTPWGTWLSCEETVIGPSESYKDVKYEHKKDHGWVFEVPATGFADPTPIKGLGRFVHEAIAIDPESGIVYETEDRKTAGFYRFIPKEKGNLRAGGKLQMMKVKNRDDVRTECQNGEQFEVEWVDIEDPSRRHSPGTEDTLGVYFQGKEKGATTFGRLEGCWYGDEMVYFDCTDGGDQGCGQIWSFSPKDQVLTLVFESPSRELLDSPDNLTVSPRGGLVLCEDGDDNPMRLHALSRDVVIKPLAMNNVQLKGERNNISGDFRVGEWAGACFSPDGKWLFANIQDPGITFAITGPWETMGI